jgi:hypothetical protein
MTLWRKRQHPWHKCRKILVPDKIIICQHRMCRWDWRWN